MKRRFFIVVVAAGAMLAVYRWLFAPDADATGNAQMKSDKLDPKPFFPLPSPRSIDDVDLPKDLAEFYRHNEGFGLEATPEDVALVRLCTLAELKRIGWSDLHVIGGGPIDGWEDFAAYRIGMSMYFDEIVYVLNAPSCPRGSIFATGVDLSGPGGDGEFAYQASIVLAASLQEWIELLERFNWTDFGLFPGEVKNLPDKERLEVQRYYKKLNPRITWGGP